MTMPVVEVSLTSAFDASLGPHRPPRAARIDEGLCIGCTLCIQACPVDAIIGAPKLMHAVLTDECTGCDLCVEPCPVDCIEMVARPIAPGDPTARERADRARWRYQARSTRLAKATDLTPAGKKSPDASGAVAQQAAVTPTAARNSDRAARTGKSPLVELAVARAKAIRRRMDGRPGRHS